MGKLFNMAIHEIILKELSWAEFWRKFKVKIEAYCRGRARWHRKKEDKDCQKWLVVKGKKNREKRNYSGKGLNLILF